MTKSPFKRKYKNARFDPDAIFLDSQNLPDFDRQQFEGELDKPISRNTLFSIGIVFSVIIAIFAGRLWSLQITHGDSYKKMSQNNSLDREPIFASRGNIYDRNGVPLVWNTTKTEESPWGQREYISSPGFSNILGYVGYPQKDSSGNYWQKEIIGKDGLEKQYDTMLSGTNGSHIVERDIAGKEQGEAMVDPPIDGQNLNTTIDSRLQTELHKVLQDYTTSVGFQSASGILIDIYTGEVIAMTNVPEYDSNIMSGGTDNETIKSYFTNKNTPLLNRAVSGLFTPGSIVKPYIALEALNEGVIDPMTKIESRGSISVPNPYSPDKPSIFRDYNPDNGWVDMRHALELSSNIYFFEVGGGYKSQKGIGIYNIDKAWLRFGMTKPTGIDLPAENTGTLPNPEWKAQKFNGEAWRLGDTYNTAIGQYGVQVTPVQMARAVAAIARKGILVTPHLLKGIPTVETKVENLPDSYYTVVQEGMRLGAIHGTTPDVTPVSFNMATKSGTAQVGPGGKNVNSWMTGFFPYEKPRYAFALMFENGPADGIGTSHKANRTFLGWVSNNAPEYGQIQ